MSDLTKVTPPQQLAEEERRVVFQHFHRRLAGYRNTVESYALAEQGISPLSSSKHDRQKEAFVKEIFLWSQKLLEHAWIACLEPEGGRCPMLDPLSDSSTGDLPRLPAEDHVSQLMNTILFLDVTQSKVYSARSRTFIWSFAPVDEHAVVSTLKNPDEAVKEAQRKTAKAKDEQAAKGKTLRFAAMGLGAVAGGALIGVTGGLAAPVVGGAVTTILGWVGVGGTAAGVLASGLASSSVVCGTLFGVYGARSSAKIVERHTREVHDLALLPVNTPKETMAVRICVSGWLSDKGDVTAPWSIFKGDDTYALQWEVEALEALAKALETLLKQQAIKYIKAQIIKRTVFAALFSILSPTAWLQIGQIIDNPWMNAKSLAVKAGKVLGVLLAEHVLGTRPVTLVGYSLGSLVIFEALKHLATLPPSETAHIVQDVYLYGTPVPTDEAVWSSVRRVVAGRLVNGYCEEDYILMILSRASDAVWGVAGLQPVAVKGVENLKCGGVDGHLKWRGMVGHCLKECNAPGIRSEEVRAQMNNVLSRIQELEPVVDEGEADEVIISGPDRKLGL
ncbi:DUF726-domain-containing protein [Punctularia strigosozonata HHB-11173 SS5]|uniref:DUF726-domain-containing protein n=1 Tax=Punctularia strigosozonata (strain HHB-11173) TaxID=741275 RepID=UPI0004417F6C|nr:DUF726-domain-containing protein [Punctularia strigosozonata HHB-11173 SS5]EIN07221.1 DUF726-domain-containing protein [Punctularia strigosozonata HHB-11173 SS5]